MNDPMKRIKEVLRWKEVNRPPLNGHKAAAVLVPFYYDGSQWGVLFTKRTDKVETHKGQISFPGGGREPQDASFAETALRETEEEIGVGRQKIEVLGRLDPIVTVTDFLVHPFVGIIPYPYEFKLNRFEVDKLIKLPLAQLIEEAGSQTGGSLSGLDFSFNRRGDLIWGATARILHQLLEEAFLRARPQEGNAMIECPICRESFDPAQAVIYQDGEYCSTTCAQIAATEGKNTSDQIEAEEVKSG